MLEQEQSDGKFNYPYRSTMAEEFSDHPKKFELSVSDNFSIQDVIDQRKGDILEIAGFCSLGYYFLDGISLPKAVILGNIDTRAIKSEDLDDSHPQEYTDEAEGEIDMIMDDTHAERADSSLGVVLSTRLSYYPEYNLHYDEDEMRERAESASRRVIEQGDGDTTEDIVKDSLRLKAASEVFRKLEPGGLYITDMTQDEIDVMKLLGFQLRASLSKIEKNEEPYYYVVLQKPTDDSMVQ